MNAFSRRIIGWDFTQLFQYAVESLKISLGESNKTHPGTVVPPGSNGRDGGGNKAVRVLLM